MARVVNDPLLLATDLGTSSCKTTLFELDGTPVGSAAAEYPIHTPQPGWAEQDPDEWWRAVCHSIRGALRQSDCRPERVAAVGLDSQSGAAVCLDRHTRPVYPATIYLDKRSAAICDRLSATELPRLLHFVNGNPLDTSLVAPRILWLKEQEPAAYTRISHILPGSGYLAYRLTGQLSFSLTEGAFTGLFDTAKGAWSCELADAWGLGLQHLATLRAPHDVVGHMSSAAASDTGLCAGTPVVSGAMDAAASAFGLGGIQAGQAIGMLGTSFTVLAAVSRPPLGSGLWVFHAATPGLWILAGGVDAAGGALRWLRDEVASEERQQAEQQGISPYEVMTVGAARVPEGADGLIFLPYLAGARAPQPDPHRRGVFFGLTLKHTRAHLVRAVLEGCAFRLLQVLEAVSETGVDVDSLLVCGGAAASHLWLQIIADVCAIPLLRSTISESSCLGSAMLAGMGVGLYTDAPDAVSRTFRPHTAVYPRPQAAERYRAVYRRFRELDEALDDCFTSSAGH